MGLLSKIFGRGKATEKQMGYPLPISGGMIPGGWPWNWWQQGKNPVHGGTTATVEACVNAYAETLASMSVGVYSVADDGHKTRKANIAADRILRNPNQYQTSSDFELNMIKALMIHGNAYAVALRNDRNEVSELHQIPSQSTQPYIEPETRQIFYGAGDNPVLGDLSALIPARDVLHIRLYTPRHPLVGVSPIEHAAGAIAANSSITNHQAAFFSRMSRPSGVLSTEQKLNREQMVQLRQAWEEQSKGLDSGGIPILSSGIKWEQMAISSQDAQLVDAFNMSVTDIARAFRVPLPLVQLYENATYNNVEQLYAQWLSGGLGFLLEHVERSMEKFFTLPANMVVNYDADSLLRTDFAARVEGYTRLVQSGVMTVNEARVKVDGMPPVDNGDQPIVQQQMVPLGWTEQQAEQEPAPAIEAPDDTTEQAADPEVTKALVVNLLAEKRKRGAA